MSSFPLSDSLWRDRQVAVFVREFGWRRRSLERGLIGSNRS